MQVHDGHAPLLFDAAAIPETRAQRFDMLYHELRHSARQLRRRGNTNATLSPSTVLHATFLSLAQRDAVSCGERAEFMSNAARVMRRMIIEQLRNCGGCNSGNGFELTPLATATVAPEHELQIARLSDAVDELAHIDAHLAECIDLRFFCGFSFEEIADLWQLSLRTVRRDWDKARFLLSTLMDETARASCTARTS